MEQRTAELEYVELLTRKPTFLSNLWRFVRTKPVGAVAAFVVIAMLLSAALAPWITPYDPLSTRIGPIQGAPSLKHLFGTDSAGRDELSRVISGGRTSLMIGIMAVLFGTMLGSFIGLISGYFEGKVDLVLQRMVDSLMSFPAMILALSVISVLGPSTRNLIITIAVVIIPSGARIVRGAVLTIKQNVYVEAARAVGARDGRILFMHVLPNVVAPILIIVSVQIGNAILLEASLSFLGLGTPPPNPSWGSMLSEEGRSAMETAPWLGIFPGLFLSLAVMGFNLFGDALRDVLDPRLRGGTRA